MTSKPYIGISKTKLYCLISLSAFLLLWLSAMSYLPIVDAVILLIIIACIVLGSTRGVGELFRLLGVVALFLLALNGYMLFANLSANDLGATDLLSARSRWFLTIWCIGSVIGCILWSSIDHSVSRKPHFFLGAILGSVKGCILAYIFVIMSIVVAAMIPRMPVSHKLCASYIPRIIEKLETQYCFLNHLSPHNWSTDLQIFYNRIRIARLDFFLPSQASLREKTFVFLYWLNDNPSQVSRFLDSEIAKRYYAELSKISQVRKFFHKCPRPKSAIDIYRILQRPQVKKLSKISAVSIILDKIDIAKIQRQLTAIKN